MTIGIYAALGLVATYLLVFILGVYVGKKLYREFLESIGKDEFGNDKAAGK